MKGPTLIAEKPSFSRGPDGKYPFGVASFRETMTNLKNDTRSLSTKGDYSLADSSYKQIAVVRQQEKVHRKAEEHGRQREEKLNLDKAYKIEKERFEAAWAKNIEQVERECEEKLRILRVPPPTPLARALSPARSRHRADAP